MIMAADISVRPQILLLKLTLEQVKPVGELLKAVILNPLVWSGMDDRSVRG